MEFIAAKVGMRNLLGGCSLRREKGKVRTLREMQLHVLFVPGVAPLAIQILFLLVCFPFFVGWHLQIH